MAAALNQCPPTQYAAFCINVKNLRSLRGIPYARKACQRNQQCQFRKLQTVFKPIIYDNRQQRVDIASGICESNG